MEQNIYFLFLRNFPTVDHRFIIRCCYRLVIVEYGDAKAATADKIADVFFNLNGATHLDFRRQLQKYPRRMHEFVLLWC